MDIRQNCLPKVLFVDDEAGVLNALKAIAMDLVLSIKTVSTYKKRLVEQMAFKNDVELIGYALKNNLLQQPACKIIPAQSSKYLT